MKKDEQGSGMKKNTGITRAEQFRRRLLPALVASCFACGPVFANPTGGQVVSGQATINTNGNVTTVTNTPGAIINWASFSINAGQITQFLQQNSSSSVLNRIIGQNPSQIFGTLESNGKVFLINPNGILFEPGSQINVGGLVASSLNISNADFLAGKNNFTSSTASPGSVVNQGSITTPSGGNIYLIAPQVQNSGVLTSPQGEILLAAGHSVQLVDGADPNIQIVISAPTDAAVNLGRVIAQGGKIGIYGALVNQGGSVSADSAVVGQNGEVVFKSSQTTTVGQNSVTSAAGRGVGGTIEVLGPDVEIVDNAVLNASGQTGGGKVMIGGDFHGANAGIPDSTSVFVGSEATIKADAIQSGEGGKVAVWSNNGTLFYGSISAQGGAQGGDGGYVETSSKNYLDFAGTVSLKAPKGNNGTLLLDPDTITITDSGSDTIAAPTGSAPITYTSGVSSVLTTTTLEGLLNGNSNVLVQTGASPGGVITVNAGSALAWTTASTLALVASTDINIQSPITAASGTLSLQAVTGNINQTVGGVISVASLAAVANLGNVNLATAVNNVGTIAGSAGGSGGFQFANGTGALAVGSAYGVNGISATSGSIGLQSGGSISITQPISTPATLSLISNTGSISQTGGGYITAGNLSVYAPNGPVTLNSYNSVTGTVAGTSAGAFSFVDTPSFSVGATVTAVLAGTPDQTGITATGNAITLTSTAGSIGSSGGGAITGASANISALYGIGGQGNPLNTAVGTLTVSNGCNDGCSLGFGGGGDIVIANTGDVIVTGMTQLNTTNVNPANIILTNTGAVDITGSISTTVGSIGVTAGNGTLTVYGAISAGNGNIGLTANNGAITTYSPISASGTVALQASGNISESTAFCSCTPTITAGSLSAVSSGGYVSLTNAGNAVGTIAGSAAGSNGGIGFSFISNSAGVNIGSVAGIGGPFSYLGTTNGITSTGATAAISLIVNGDINLNGPVNAGSSNITLENYSGNNGSINQGTGGMITTTGELDVEFQVNVGASGAGNALQTDVGTLYIPNATGNVYINNIGTGNLTLNSVNTSGVVNVVTAGSLTTAPAIQNCDSACFYPTNFTGSSITFVSAGNMLLGSNNTYLANDGTGPINLYAGYTEVPGSSPVANVTTSTLTQDGTLNGSSINLWANSYSDFLNVGAANFSTTPVYYPSAAPIDIYVTGTTVADKTYDGTTTASLSGGTLQGVPGPDQAYVSLTQAGNFNSKNVGTAVGVTAADVLNLPAALAGDFVLIQPGELSANILAAQLTVLGQTANKIYDGTTVATLSGGTLSGIIGSEDVNLTASNNAQYISKNAGTNITVTLNTPDTIYGSGAGNYVLVQPTITGTIAQAQLTVLGQTASNKIYDGTVSATLQGGGLQGLIAGDVGSVTLVQAGSFVSRNAGTNVAVNAADSLTGSNAINYFLSQPGGLTATITPASLSVTGQSAVNKVYDGTLAATLQSGGLQGLVAGDSGNVTLVQAGNFVSTNAGVNIAVNAADSLIGSSAANYVLSQPTGLSATIIPAQLTVIGQSAVTKIYDGTVAATLQGGGLQGLVASDVGSVSLVQAGSFVRPNAGTNVAVGTADSLSGSSAANYVLSQPTGVTGTISPAPLTVFGQTAANKLYDGTTTATLQGGALQGFVAGDAANISLVQAGNFATSNPGNNIAVIANDSLAGSGSGNYYVVQPTGLAANILGASATTLPVIYEASNSFIVALNTSTSTILNGSGSSAPTGGASSGGTTISAPTTNGTNDDKSTKLYCN